MKITGSFLCATCLLLMEVTFQIPREASASYSYMPYHTELFHLYLMFSCFWVKPIQCPFLIKFIPGCLHSRLCSFQVKFLPDYILSRLFPFRVMSYSGLSPIPGFIPSGLITFQVTSLPGSVVPSSVLPGCVYSGKGPSGLRPSTA